MNKLINSILFTVFWIVGSLLVFFCWKGITGDFPPEIFIGWMGGQWAAYLYDGLRESTIFD
jgi:hypothetical protein